MAGQDRSKDAVHRACSPWGKRLLRKLQLQAAGRVPQRGDLLLDKRTARAGRTLARPLQHHQAALVAGLQITGTHGLADKQHGPWRSGNRYALPTSPHPRRRLLELRNSCATLTHPVAQKIGHSSSAGNRRVHRRELSYFYTCMRVFRVNQYR